MSELPLFPLDMVLFPNMPVDLHIFEPRYREMMSYCIDNQRPFGVVLIRRGNPALGPLAEPHAVGVSAQIVNVQKMADGRMNITAVGANRFRIRSLDYDSQSYLVGDVEDYPLAVSDPHEVAGLVRTLRPLVKRYLDRLSEVAETNLSPDRIPSDVRTLAFLSAILLQVPNIDKQRLLATEDASDFLRDAIMLYRRELALLGALLSAPPNIGTPFSQN